MTRCAIDNRARTESGNQPGRLAQVVRLLDLAPRVQEAIPGFSEGVAKSRENSESVRFQFWSLFGRDGR